MNTSAEKICANCAHWTKAHWAHRQVEDGAAICALLSQRDTPEVWLAQAACFSEGINGELMTKPNFGCVEWKSK
jgi:hypothetical protein